MTSVDYATKPLHHLQPRFATTTDAEQAEGLRRALNLMVATLGLVVTAPLMAAIALAIKVTSPGPVFYTQSRIGIDRRARGAPGNSRRLADCGGKPFQIYKFRTMAAQTAAQPVDEVWAKPDDPRVTPLGRILRLYRLDELPQLINVLLGDMNVVGPRPEQPTIFARMREHIECYQDRQRVRPGITGWAQVNQRYDSSVDDVKAKVKFDLEYIERQSVLEDLRIMARTLPVIVGKRGAW